MAITKSAKKALRQSVKRKVFNTRRNNTMKKIIKDIRALVAGKKVAEAEKMLAAAYKAIDKAAKTNFIKKGTADRKKSRMALLIGKASKMAA